jgi:hypothetical protein
MAPNTDTILTQIDAALSRFDQVTAQARGPEWSNVPDSDIIEVETALIATIERLSPSGSRYREAVQESIGINVNYHAQIARDAVGVLKALRADYVAGYLRSIEELIHADLFGDFLEMAAHLLKNKFKDAAAVITGSSLEAHLRQLANKAGVPVEDQEGRPLKAERINADLAKALYGKGDQKLVTAWLDLRNEAAHGHYENYDESQVRLMLDGVRDFIRRHPG